MVSTISFCFLVGIIGIVSSQASLHAESSSLTEQLPVSERRTLGHIKSIKRIPIFKKHKKFGKWLPHVKTEFATVPIHEVSHPPLYKFHRYNGIDLKPVEDSTSVLSFSPLEFYPKSHSYSPLLSPEFTYFSSSPPKHAFHDLSPKDEPIIKPILSSLPIKTTINSVSSIPPPVFVPSFPTPSPVTFFKNPEPIQQLEPLLPSLPLPLPPPHSLPAPLFPSTRPLLPPLRFAPSFILPSTPLFHPTIPLPQISTPTPILPSLPAKDSFPPPNLAFSSTTTTNLASPSLNFPSHTTPEPDFSYPPSDTPIPSHIKDISLTDHLSEVPQNVPEVNIVEKDITKYAAPILTTSKPPDTGLLNKLKGWKIQTANAAFNHLNKFNKFQHSTGATYPTVSDKTPSTNLLSTWSNFQLPLFPSLPFQPPSLSDPNPASLSFPYQNSLPPLQYEHFPPNNNELTPPLFNSYGIPIPHDSYAPPRQGSHDRISPEASEEKLSLLPPIPNLSEETSKHSFLNNEQNQGTTDEPQTSQSPIEFQTKNFGQFKPPSEVIFKERPVYVSDNKDILKEGGGQTEEASSQLHHSINLEDVSGEKGQDLGDLSNHRKE